MLSLIDVDGMERVVEGTVVNRMETRLGLASVWDLAYRHGARTPQLILRPISFHIISTDYRLSILLGAFHSTELLNHLK